MLASAVLLGATLLGQPGDSARTMVAFRITAAEGTPVLDGRLDEEVWQSSETASDFVQVKPRPGAPASQRTEVRVLYAADALFVAMRMYDSHPDSIAAQLGRRDQEDIYSDWAHVGIDSYAALLRGGYGHFPLRDRRRRRRLRQRAALLLPPHRAPAACSGWTRPTRCPLPTCCC
jgi:hypothetical protein